MDGSQAMRQRVFDLKQMVQVSPRIIAAAKTIAAFIRGIFIASIPVILDI
jgi:hypothetical protein